MLFTDSPLPPPDPDNNNGSTGKMNESDRIKLQRNYNKLIEVSYSTISAHLISNFIIDLEMHADIEALPTDRRKIDKLLTILPSRGNHAMVEFIKALKPNYCWIADKLSEGEGCTTSATTTTPTNVLNDFNSNTNNGPTIHNCNIIGTNSTNQLNTDGFPSTSTFNYGNSENLKDISITKYMKPVTKVLQTSVTVCRNWCLVANAMGIDPCTLTDIKRQMNYEGGTAYAIHSVLDAWVAKSGPSRATFAHLTSITEGESINDVTEALVDLWKTLQ